MLSSELIQGRTYRFEVNKEISTRKFYKIKTDDGLEFSLQKFKFQKNLPLPDYIDCYVKSLYPITLGQDISLFIKDFYQEGCEYDFKIKSIKTDGTKVYELEDDHDLCFKLFNAPDNLAVGNRIKCKISKIRGINVSLKYVGTLTAKLPLDYYDIAQWLDFIGIHKKHDIYLSLIESQPELQSCLIKYDESDPIWILELLKIVAHRITDWLIECKDNRRLLAKTIRRMNIARQTLLYILEESDFLRNCDINQRTSLQSQLSDYVELFDQYNQAASKIFDKTHEEFIDQIFSRLKKAGYLYKPAKQFMVMMTILKLRPELINVRMGELFEALHNWELSNWMSEPFRGALVQQLQIFIKENCRQINLLPANDSSEDNKAITRMILAIAVQSILAKDSDKVDLTINRAMLYRYVSYLYPDSLLTLLDKGTDAILGFERTAEYVWSDTEHPTLLMLKMTHPAPISDERNNLVKIYTTSKAAIQLRPGSLNIIATDSEPDNTVIPNNLINWLNPRISLVDDIKIHNIKKTKDLKAYKQLWDDIAWSIFGNEQTAGDKIEKKRPDDGDEVKIIIDNVRILKDVPKSQQLQFHCTIIDDLYIGDGWMPCDKSHMLRWLTSSDIPSNYNGSISFAQDETGSPLFFYANAFRKGDSLLFSIKAQIEDYLLECMWPGEESICIVTHLDRINNAWLCLSEKGCTFKVPCDETTENMVEGRLVRVRYIEPDRSGQSIEFFIGELSENQFDIPASIKKSDCLFNLMQGMGEVSQKGLYSNSEVMETEEVMSREELLEIIYMFQRCAYSEKEYIKAFNYLGLASILCKIADEHELIKEISTHMELLQLLQDFGRNQKVNSEWLAECENKVKNIPLLERLYTRLRIVDNLDLNENADWLWEVRKNPRNDTERRLVSLVLSYNMLPKELEKPRKDIIKEISTLLNVNSTTPSSKYYGDESQTVEFKSSLIYSSHGGSRPEVKEQLFEIVHIICGFMNARGGNLFIGVNDSGYENGLDDDLGYRKSHGLKPTIDAMMVDLQNHLDRVMPKHAKDHWEIESDPESKKGVIVVKVLPVEEPVEHDGIIYVRSSSTTKPRLGEQREEFIKSRSHNYHLLMKLWGIGQNESQPEEASEIKSMSYETEANEYPEQTEDMPRKTILSKIPDTTDSITIVDTDDPESYKITTGSHRSNVLHSYEANFVTPAFYLYFLRDMKIMYSSDDAYFDYEPECRLTIAVRDREKNGFLILSYIDGSVAKVPLSHFSTFSENESRLHRKDSSLDFANIGTDNDYLLSVIESIFGGLFYRMDRISDIAEASFLSDNGMFLCDNQYRILAQEIIPTDKLAFFDADAIGKESRFYGVPVPQGDGTLSIQERIEKLLKPAAHTE